jgi:hypothetical protein
MKFRAAYAFFLLCVLNTRLKQKIVVARMALQAPAMKIQPPKLMPS